MLDFHLFVCYCGYAARSHENPPALTCHLPYKGGKSYSSSLEGYKRSRRGNESYDPVCHVLRVPVLLVRGKRQNPPAHSRHFPLQVRSSALPPFLKGGRGDFSIRCFVLSLQSVFCIAINLILFLFLLCVKIR